MLSEDIIISKIIEEPNIWFTVIDRGVKADFFPERKNQFLFIQKFYSDYGNIPSKEVFLENYPVWEFKKSEEKIEYWVDKLRKDKSFLIQSNGIESWLEERKNESDPDKLAKKIIKLATDLMNTSLARDISLKDIESEKKFYKEKKTNEGLQGLQTGLIHIDNQIRGLMSGDLGVIMGPPENFKTWLLNLISYNVWVGADVPCLFISKEMEDVAIRDRMSWFDFRFPLNAFERGVLGPELERRYFKALDKREERQDFIISAEEEMDQGAGVTFISAKIDRYKPKACFIDGAYLLSDDRGHEGWEGTKHVFRDLKRLARARQIPILVTTQPQRLKDSKGEPLRRKLIMEDVGSAYTISQDADYMIGVRQIAPDVIQVYKIKCRRGNSFDFQLQINFEEGIVRELGGEEIIEEENSNELLFD
ncbi:MAG: DnaB-like helicase C-terminal domain-containing protein [Nanoarchaeota archaeon]